MAHINATNHQSETEVPADKAKVATLAGILAAIGASSCCIVPLLLFSFGISGAWIGQLTALEPYKPIFMLLAGGFLAYGYWRVYKTRQAKCAPGTACARPQSNRLVMSGLVAATMLVLLSLFWPLLVPIILS
ncbi:mercuric transporter MerT family protein [Maritalea mediterranea]|uniref:Mercuric transport protein MerT n=1 Tax=Maritalea mediterranea TaxID=2909667 RepID=A0ABS9E6J6_9HYPH|nr:mercuric transporter MerT family protein [Maritalea mediterranea]MCF4098432.1 mercury transporter MerT [Maritalea mediterranea]